MICVINTNIINACHETIRYLIHVATKECSLCKFKPFTTLRKEEGWACDGGGGRLWQMILGSYISGDHGRCITGISRYLHNLQTQFPSSNRSFKSAWLVLLRAACHALHLLHILWALLSTRSRRTPLSFARSNWNIYFTNIFSRTCVFWLMAKRLLIEVSGEVSILRPQNGNGG